MRIAICDDDAFIIEKLKRYLADFFEQRKIKCPEISCFTNGEDLLKDTGEIDICFLDIEMPGMNGIYVGEQLKKSNKDIIIFVVTSYAEYLDEAMKFHVFRYLSKPIDKQRLFRNLKDAVELYSNISVKIPVETKDGVNMLSTNDIVCVEAVERKVIVHTINRDYNSIHTMNYWADKLPKNNFFRTHRSFIVNFEHITNFDHTVVHLNDGKINAYLTRRKYTEFKKEYLFYMESTR